MISIRYMYVLVHAERHMYCMYVPVSVHIISCRSSFSSTKPNDNNSYSMYLLILRDRTDGRSAGNLHVSKACNCLVSQTKHTNRHEALLIGSIGYDFTSNVLTMYPNHVSTTPQLHTSQYSTSYDSSDNFCTYCRNSDLIRRIQVRNAPALSRICQAMGLDKSRHFLHLCRSFLTSVIFSSHWQGTQELNILLYRRTYPPFLRMQLSHCATLPHMYFPLD